MLLKSILFLSSALALTDAFDPPDSFDIDSDFVPGRFIVEFADPDSLAKRSLDSDPASAFTSLLNSHGLVARTALKYNAPDLFVGASFDTISSDFASDIDLLQHLKSLPDVKAAWPVRRITTHAPIPNSPAPLDSQTPSGFGSQDDDKSFHSDSSSFNYPPWSPHALTGVDALHSQGITGKNITIGIVDSGTFYLDPALGAGFGPGYKVAGGWNFMGSAYDPSIQGFAIPNNNTLDCLGHGTHVAGIAAALNSSRFVGVAPDAHIMSYKVFGCTESTSEDVVIAAIQKAYTDGCDVINVSLGSDGGGYQNNPIAAVIDKISNNGVFVVASAGNSGTMGAFNGNQDATGNLVTSVGAANTGLLLGYEAEARASNGDSFRFTFVAPRGVQPNMTASSFDLTVASQDACSLGSLPKGSGDSAVLFPQGNCTGIKFYQTTHDLGFKLIVSYNPDFDLPTSAPTQYLQDSVFRIQAERSLGEWVSTQTSQGHSIKLVFSEDSFVPRSLINSDDVSPAYYSSLGPDYSGNLYPLVSAPGTGIFSTYLNNTYAQLDGTSMAAPYITGVLALYLQSIGGRPANVDGFVAKTQHKLVHTANSMMSGDHLAPLIKTGSGFVNATSFINTKSYFGTSSLSLGLNPDVTSINVTLYNDADNAVTYKLSHIGAPTVLSKSSSGLILQSLPLVYTYASVHFDSDSVEVPAKSSVTITASFELPTGIDSSAAPIFQGKLEAVSDSGIVAVPYVATVTDRFNVWTNDRQPLFLYDVDSKSTLSGANYSATKNSYTGTPSDGDLPWINVSYNSYLYMPVLSGAQVLNVAVVAENFTKYDLALPLAAGKNGVLGFIAGFPVSMYPRTQGGLYARISTPGIPTGKYRLFAHALPAVPNVSSNSTNVDDWNTFLTEPFGFTSQSTYPSSNSVSQTSAFGPGVASNLGGIIAYLGTVTSASTNASMAISPYDTLRISIPFRALNGLKVGSSFSVQLPEELTGFPEGFKAMTTAGQQVLDVAIVNNNLTATCVADPGLTYISGTLAFGARLKDPEQYKAAAQVPLLFTSPNYAKGFAPNVLDIAPRDPTTVSLAQTKDGVELVIPAGISNVSVSLKSSGVSFSCGSVALAGGDNYSSSVDAPVACAARELSVSSALKVSVPLDLPATKDVAVLGKVWADVRGSLDGADVEFHLDRAVIGNKYVDYSTPLTGLERK